MLREFVEKIVGLSGPKTFKIGDFEYFGNDRTFELIMPPIISAIPRVE